MDRKQNAFTLIELLVVVAIIALLLSVIVPSLKLAKERAMDVICVSNIKEYQLAMKLYCNNNNDFFANGEDWIFRGFINGSTEFPPAGHPFGCVWHDASLYPNGTVIQYLGDNGVALCPLFERLSLSLSLCATNPPSPHVIPLIPQFNYTLSAYLGDYRLRGGCVDQVKKITSVRSPSQVVMFGEENPMRIVANVRKDLPGGTPVTMNDCLLWPFDPAGAKTRIASLGGKHAKLDGSGFNDTFGSFHRAKDSTRYLGSANGVFVDGHVQYIAPEETLKFMWPY
jgi:prepilin-type N-terminal cleavage/methylation domain-containing protein/prepilin-type processing-associated H-X9-DG protein